LIQSEQRERERLARVLHDNLQQLLIGARYRLTSLRSRVKDESSRKAVDVTDDLLNQSLQTSRSLTVELNPTILFDAGLDAALPWLARQWQTNHGLVAQTDMNAHVEPDEDGAAVLLFQTVRDHQLPVPTACR
jgi:signal transduction histidine kinase